MKGPTLVVWGVVAAMLCPSNVLAAWGSGGESVLLQSIEVLTLYSGKMTKGIYVPSQLHENTKFKFCFAIKCDDSIFGCGFRICEYCMNYLHFSNKN